MKASSGGCWGSKVEGSRGRGPRQDWLISSAEWRAFQAVVEYFAGGPCPTASVSPMFTVSKHPDAVSARLARCPLL